MEVLEYKGNNVVLKRELETYKKKALASREIDPANQRMGETANDGSEGFRTSRNDRKERSE